MLCSLDISARLLPEIVVSRQRFCHKARSTADGKELFYLTQGSQLMSVEVASRGGSLELQKPQPLFRNSAFAARIASGGRLGLGVQPFDVARDGRFIITLSSDVTPSPITVLTNWYAALKKK